MLLVGLLDVHVLDAGRREAPELQRHGPERHVGHRLVNGAGPQFPIPDQAENFAPARRGDGREHGRFKLHDFNLYKTKLMSSTDSASAVLAFGPHPQSRTPNPESPFNRRNPCHRLMKVLI